jgi:ribose transport system permease protein
MVVPPAEVPVVPDDPARGPEEIAAVAGAARRRALRWGLRLVELGPVLILAVLVIVMGILSPYFFKSNNLTNLGFQTAVIAALAIGQLMVILTRGIDLSVGSTVAFTGVLAAVVGGSTWGGHLVPVLAAALAGGLAVGLVNGVIYVGGRVPHPFIVTLATLGAVRGLALIGRPRRTLNSRSETVLSRSRWASSSAARPASASTSKVRQTVIIGRGILSLNPPQSSRSSPGVDSTLPSARMVSAA